MAAGTNTKHMLFVCDIQEGFRNAIHEFPAVVETTKKVLATSAVLKIPIIATTQNKLRLGAMVEELQIEKYTECNVDKTKFSMVTPEVEEEMEKRGFVAEDGSGKGKGAVTLVGIETHICLQQTCLDLLRKGYNVYVLADAVSSCNRQEIPIALSRMRRAGAQITTSESWLYEVMGDSNTPEFREILKVVKATKQSTKESLERLCKI